MNRAGSISHFPALLDRCGVRLRVITQLCHHREANRKVDG